MILSKRSESAGFRVHDIAFDRDVVGHQRVIADEVDCLIDSLVGVVKTVEPAVKVDAAVLHEIDIAFGDASLLHKMLHLGAIHALNATTGVTDNHYFLYAKLVDRNEETAHRAVKRVCNRAAGVFDDFHVTVAEAEGCRQQLDETGIHTGDDSDAFVGIFVCAEALVAPFSYESAIMFKYFVNHNLNQRVYSKTKLIIPMKISKNGD